MLETDDALDTTSPEAPRRRATDRVRVRALDSNREFRLTVPSARQAMIVAMLAFVATALTLASGDTTSHVRFIFFDCAVVAAAIYAGLPGGLFVILVGILVVSYEWLPPHGTLRLGDPASVFAVLGFAVGGLIVTALAARFRQQARQLREARDAAVAAEERRRLVAEAGHVLAASLDYEKTVASVAQLAVPSFADGCLVDLVVDGGVKRLAIAHVDPEKVRLLQDLEVTVGPTLIEEAGIAAVIHTGEPEFVPVVTDKLLREVSRNADQLEQLRALEICSVIIVPMSTRGMILGALTLVSSRPERRFTESDFHTAQALGRRAAVAIDNARLYRAARSANDVKNNFIATMSHELRTPLTAIIGFQELLIDGVSGPVSEGQRQPLERIKASALRLLSLIEEILMFARLDAGTEIINVEKFPAKRVIDDVVAFASSAAKECKLGLRAESVTPDLELESDFMKVRQILVTLVSNALKFTTEGEIVLRAYERDGVVFEVQDTGVGIDHDALEHIFDPFWQVDQSKTRRTGGSGLGLTVARRLAQLLGGDVSVESTPSVGSTFRVRLPRSAPRLF
ncbi:MAG TPA: ATP-binding protein [Gemmatimonadaceae bacterium]